MEIYEEFSMKKVINASGTMTHLGGSIPDPRVMDAMKEASQSFVIMMELIEKAGKVIAEATGAEAGLVTAGASASLVLAAAACIMRGSGLEEIDVKPTERLSFDGEWREIIQRLPNASWTRNEIIIQKRHRDPYDHAHKLVGGKMVVVGTVEGCSSEELEAAINERTTAIAFTAKMEDVGVPLKNVVEIAHRHNIPVIVDAAGELPPRSNLRRFIADGADLVAFSGGKEISGPNDTGILCGSRNLIKLATLQAPPYRGINRAAKVDRTQIVGLIVALRIWLEKDEEAEFKAWTKKAQWMTDNLSGNPRVSKAEVVVNEHRMRVQSKITLDERTQAADVVLNLRKGNPSIWVNYISPNTIEIETQKLGDGDEKVVVWALKGMLA